MRLDTETTADGKGTKDRRCHTHKIWYRMSMFNLDRFRFDKKPGSNTNTNRDKGSNSPESEKENKPGN